MITMRPVPTEWNEPPWDAPLDVDALVSAIPTDATLTGTFLGAVAEELRRNGLSLPSMRERYTGFKPYPLREHAQLLVEASRALWPDQPLRAGLRRLGRRAPNALLSSLVGRVMLASVEGPMSFLQAMAKAYPIHMKPCEVEVVELGPTKAALRVRRVYTFLDSHHVGVFEGALKQGGAKGTVRIHAYGATDADVLCDWT